MPVIPGPVDDSGNITVPTDGGTVIPIQEQTNADPPVPVDLSTTPMIFRVKGRFEKTLVADPNNALGKLLIITDDDADTLSSTGHSFQLFDATNPLLLIPVWMGKIRRDV